MNQRARHLVIVLLAACTLAFCAAQALLPRSSVDWSTASVLTLLLSTAVGYKLVSRRPASQWGMAIGLVAFLVASNGLALLARRLLGSTLPVTWFVTAAAAAVVLVLELVDLTPRLNGPSSRREGERRQPGAAP